MRTTAEREKEIFNDALDLHSPAEQAEFVKISCGGDTELQTAVQALLTAHSAAQQFIPFRPAADSVEPPQPIEKGAANIGPYTLLEKIGEGGCGVVYRAEQQAPLRRSVAFKLLKAGMDTKQVVARFEAERQALAMMDHPNIAKVLDAGSTGAGATESEILNLESQIPKGRPYFVMELVEGARITDYCDRHQLSISERLRLFLQVCDAVQHAHQKGIIHRDLKPSNILVQTSATCSKSSLHESAIPKVIDFGIAKATQGKLTDETIHTGLHQFMGTPAYMSPEQAQMTADIDTRTDVYSLGVLLYELLTGKPPFDNHELITAGVDEMRRTIGEVEPLRPSQSLSSGAASRPRAAGLRAETEGGARTGRCSTQRAIDPDLDWIVMKCLEKDRSRRYETASAVASDIQRHLNDEPVSARPPSTTYKIQKLARKHRPAAVAFLLTSLAIFGALLTSTWAFRRERVALQEADLQLQAATNFMAKVLNEVAPAIANLPGAAQAQQELAQAGLDFVERLKSVARHSSVLKPEVARMLLQASQTQQSGQGNTTGDFGRAVEQADQAIKLLQEEIPGLSTGNRLQMLYDAKWARVETLIGAGRVEEALGTAAELNSLLSELVPVTNPSAKWIALQHALIQMETGAALVEAGRAQEAVDRYFHPFLASEIAQRDLSELDESELRPVACLNDNLTLAYRLLSNTAAILPVAARAADVLKALRMRNPRDNRYRWGLAFSNAQYGHALITAGDPAAGWPMLSQARQDIEDLVRADKSNDQSRMCRAIVAAIQSHASSEWSLQPGVTPPEREQRIAQADEFLQEAERFFQEVKSREPEDFLRRARTQLASAKERTPESKTEKP